ncbi:ankyrin repeat-containing domain protein [Lasiosphaeria miniovina]|uniref:Ankyrin repeat-containing domain protein n=1 Tax=Lasiosphaeria miniovina TaxID=1954250 RepID=A0AA39ZSV6_9PEZI|nr:ankyrin repeat-containing domain protein [Lasiosphaeria miniovina]KAK0703015.1 ankyrin repeat-containing domain protein [Lasiosphaeria miniovina]
MLLEFEDVINDIDTVHLPYGTALTVAAGAGSTDAAKLLLDHGANPDITGGIYYDPLTAAASSFSFDISLSARSAQIMDTILRETVYVQIRSETGLSLFHIACTAGSLEMVEVIIKKLREQAGPLNITDREDSTPLHFAAINTSSSVLAYLLGLGCDSLDPNAMNARGFTPLHTAFTTGTLESINLLLGAGANINVIGPDKITMLHLAAQNFQNPEVLDLLSEMDVNSRDEWDRTPLHITCGYGAPEAVEWLLDHGADPTVLDDTGRSALHFACQNQIPGSERILEVLLKKGLSPRDRDCGGSTPLHLAFHDPKEAHNDLFWTQYVKGHWDSFSETECMNKVVHLLVALDGYEDLKDLRDGMGNTILHLACWRGIADLVLLLLSMDARTDLRENRGFLPHELMESSELRQYVEGRIEALNGRKALGDASKRSA